MDVLGEEPIKGDSDMRRDTVAHNARDDLNNKQPIKSYCEGDDTNRIKGTEREEPIRSHSGGKRDNMERSKEAESESDRGVTFYVRSGHSDGAISVPEGNYRDELSTLGRGEGTRQDSLNEDKRVESANDTAAASNGHGDREVLVIVKDIKLSGAPVVEKNQHCPSTVNLMLSELDLQTDPTVIKTVKPTRIKERRTNINCYQPQTSVQTNQSFNALAHSDSSVQHRTKTKSKLRPVSNPAQVKARVRKTPDLIINGEATVSTVKSRLNSVKAGQRSNDTPSPRKKAVVELQHPSIKRPNHNPKKTLSNKKALKQPAVRELKSARQPRSTGSPGTPRSKSAVDYIQYKDMFQMIQNRDEGPAIYEMFAGPVFDNLRVSSSREEPLSRKTYQTHKVKQKPLKKLAESQKLRRSPAEKGVGSTKAKLKPAPSRVKPSLTTVPRKEMHKVEDVPLLDLETELLFLSEDDGGDDDDDQKTTCPNGPEGQEEVDMLPVIEEVLSKNGSETLKPDNEIASQVKAEHTSPRATHGRDRVEINTQGTMGNPLDNDNDKGVIKNPNRPVPEPASPRSPVQPKINTWTSGSRSGERTTSPVYQRFLDEAGDGPLTDDLLRCLAEELISLDEKETSEEGPYPEDFDSMKTDGRDYHAMGRDELLKDVTTHGGELSGPGSVLDDTITWTKGELLGRGAYGTVYCGLTSQGQLIAVKQVSLHTSDREVADREYGRLQDEVELLKTLQHGNIVGFLGTSLRRHVVSIFMEYVPGGSIASILHRFGPLPERVLALYTRQILQGVAYLHLNRVIHRDLKGNNTMLMPTGVVKLIDFGCARRLSYLSHTDSHSGDLLKSVHGTPYWMAPEVISETGHGRKSDIWSVGCTVFEMATGKPPLAHMDKRAALFYIAAHRGPMPPLPDGFSDDARDFVQVCLTSDQKLRPSADCLLKHPFIPKDKNGINSFSETQRRHGCSVHRDGLCS